LLTRVEEAGTKRTRGKGSAKAAKLTDVYFVKIPLSQDQAERDRQIDELKGIGVSRDDWMRMTAEPTTEALRSMLGKEGVLAVVKKNWPNVVMPTDAADDDDDKDDDNDEDDAGSDKDANAAGDANGEPVERADGDE
jgi:hypothetical protein